MREAVLTIVTETTTTNGEGFEVKTETRAEVPCTLKSVNRNEFYAAYAQGITLDAVFIVHSSAYDGQRTFIFEGVYYTAVRTYERPDEYIEITARRRAAVPAPSGG